MNENEQIRPEGVIPEKGAEQEPALKPVNGGKTPNARKKKKKKKKKMSVKKKILIIILIILVIVGIGIGIIFLIIHHYINLMNIKPVEESSYEIADSVVDDDITDEPDSPQEDIDDLENRIRENLEKKSDDIMADKDVLNVLLIGTDARSVSERGRSDSMILVSINKKTKKVIMTSFLRDIYLAIPNIESTRLNHAYAYGGAHLLIDTLEENFRIKIDRYAQVNFFSFCKTVDAVGGVEIDVTQDEIYYINNYLREINRLEGRAENTYQVTSAGRQTLNGAQALAYSRIRYIGTDFQRTQRQRTVLEQIISKTKDMSLTELDDLLEVVLPEITTNMQESEIISLLLDSNDILDYERVQCRVPADGTWEFLTIRSMSVIGIDFSANIQYLRDNIYG